MADNTQLNAGSGGDTIRDLDRAGVKTPIVALDLNPAGAETLMAGAMPVTAAALPLPTGAATAADQATGNASLASIDGKLTACDTGAVTVSSSALPSGAATAANQATEISGLAAILSALGGAFTVGGTVAVSNFPATQPVSGTFWQTTQPVSGTFWQTTQPVSGTFWQTTQPVSAASLPLPTGASTEATLSTLSGKVTACNTGAVVVSSGSLTANAGTNLNTSLLARESGGNLATLAGAVSGGQVQATIAAALPAGTNVIGHVIVDSGTVTTVTTVSTVTSVTAIANALPAGTNNIGQVSLAPQTSGGLSVYSVNSSGAANQDAAAIKAGAGQIYGYALFNTTSSARYVKLYNVASGVTSSSTPFLRIYLPPTGGANMEMPSGLVCGTGISIRITTGAADSDTGACSANDVLANIYYK